MHNHKEYEKNSWDCVIKLMNLNNQKFSKKTGYSVTGTTPLIERLVDLKADCFPLDTRELKKSGNLNILLADWRLYYGSNNLEELYNSYRQFLRILTENQFTVFVFQGKTLHQVKSETDLLSCYDTPMCFPQSAEINSQLSILGYDASQFHIIDHFQMFQLLEIVKEIDNHFLREDKISEASELIRLKDQALAKSNYTLSLPLNLDDNTLSRILNASRHREVKMIEFLLPQYNSTLVELNKEMTQLLAKLDSFYGKNKKPPGLKIYFLLFTNFIQGRVPVFNCLIDNCLAYYKTGELRKLHLLNYPGTLNLSRHLQIEELLITSTFSRSEEKFSLLTNPSIITNKNENKKIIDTNELTSLRSYEYNFDKETVSVAPYFTERNFTDPHAFDFTASSSLKTLFLPLMAENSSEYKKFQGKNNLVNFRSLEFLHTDAICLQGLDNFLLPELKQITINLDSLDEEGQHKFLQSLQKSTSLNYISLLMVKVKILDFSKFTHLKVLNCISATCKIILPTGLQELNLVGVTLSSPMKLPRLKVLNLQNTNLSDLDIKEAMQSLTLLKIDTCTHIDKIINCSFPRLFSLIIYNELVKPLDLDNFPALKYLDIVKDDSIRIQNRRGIQPGDDAIFQNIKKPTINSAKFYNKQFNPNTYPWILDLKSLSLRMDPHTEEAIDLRHFTQMDSLQLDMMKLDSSPRLYLPSQLNYLNLKLYFFHSLPTVINSIKANILNLDDFLSRKSLTLTVHEKDGVSSSILLTKDSFQTLLKVKPNEAGVDKIIKEPVDLRTERKSSFFPREMAMMPVLTPTRGGNLIDKCSASSGFDSQTKADPDKTYQEDRFIYRHNSLGSEPNSVKTHDYRFQALTIGKTPDLMARIAVPESSDLIELNNDSKAIKWHSQKITSADFQKISIPGCYYGSITLKQLFSTYSDLVQKMGGWMPLTMLTAQDHLSDIYLPANIKLRYNRVSQQYEVFFSASQIRDLSEEAITYIFSTQPASPFPISSRHTPPLNDELVKTLEQVFSIEDKKGLLPAEFSEFLLKFKTNQKPEARLAALVDYLSKKFTSGDLNDRLAYLQLININPTARFWVQSLIEAKGACRHRAKLFCLIATHFLKLNVRLIVRGGHEDIEYEDNGVFKRIDLGGFPLKRLPPRESLSREKDKKEEKNSGTALENKTPTTISRQNPEDVKEEIKDDSAMLLFLSELQTDVDECKSWSQLTSSLKSTQRLLLRTGDNDEARKISLGLQKEFTRLNIRFDYIENSDELEHALSSLHIDEKDGVHKLPGSLVKLITAPTSGGKPVPKCLLINWNNFTAEQMNRFKSMLDDPPMLSGLPVDPQLQIINLLNSDVNVSELFTSRCDDEIFWPRGNLELPSLPKEFLFISDSKELSTSSNEQTDKISVNLFHGGISWREALLGHILLNDGKPGFVPGALTQAVLTGARNFVIQNLPTLAQDNKEHAELMAFLTRLQITGCFTANGVCYDLRRGIKITAEGQSESLLMPPEFRISMEELPAIQFEGECKQQELINQLKNSGSRQMFIINDSNYSTFFRQVQVDEKGHLNNQPGYVEDCAGRDLILFSEDLSRGKRERVLTELRKKNKAVSWGDVSQVQKHLHESESGAILTQSTDVDFTVKNLREELAKQKRPCWHVAPVHSNMRFGELMARIEVPAVTDEKLQLWGKYQFNRKVQYKQTPLLTALLAGEDVIVHGSLGIDCYGELATLWAKPPYLQLNGRRVEVKGRLFLVTPPLAYETGGLKQAPTWKDYEAALTLEFGSEFKNSKDSARLTGIIARLGRLYQLAERLEYGKAETPPRLLWNYHRLRESVKILLNTENSNDKAVDDNPIKSLLLMDYDPFCEEYAFLNVMSKLLFGPKRQPECRREKMKKFVKQNDETYWRQLNCYNGPALHQLFNCEKDRIVKNPQIITDLLDIKSKSGLPRLLVPAKRISAFTLPESKNPDIKPVIGNKHLRKVLGFLKQNPFAFLKGLPGTGKSFTAEIFSQGNIEGFGTVATFWGEEQIDSWIHAKDGDYFILFIDEANLNNPQDYWNFLKDLRQQPPSIYWKGQRILLGPKHKVIFTGNPEHYSRQRDFHTFLEEMPIDFYKAWPDGKIVAHLSKLWQEITSPISSAEEKAEIPVIQLIVKAMHTLEETFPTLFPPGRLTLRDLHQVMHRLDIRRQLGLDFKNLAYTLCVDEWLPLVPTHEQRDAFRQELNKLFSVEKYPDNLDEKLVSLNPEWEKIREFLHIPQERWHDVLVMYEDLKLQKQRFSTENNHRIKNAILLEGPSGIGKTTLLLGLLTTLGYSKITPEELTAAFKQAQLDEKELKLSPNTFIHLTAGDAHNAELLTQAFMLGIPVVFDELDLQPLPELLNHLLTGTTPDKVKPYRQGFFLAASLNSGRMKLPLDFENRFRKVYLQAYSDSELREIATQALTKAGLEFKPEDVNEFVNKYNQAKTLRNGKMNARNFFRTLKKVIAKSSEERSFMKCWNILLEERREKLLMKEQGGLISDADETGMVNSTSIEIPENKQEVLATFFPQEHQPVSEKINSEISSPVTPFLAELIKLNPDSAQEFKRTQFMLAEIYRNRPLVTPPPVSQSFFSFKESSPSEDCVVRSIYLICLLQMTPVEHEQRLAILQNAANIAASLPKAKKPSPQILADEEKLFEYLTDSRNDNWAMKEALLWIMQQGWDKEFVAAAPSQSSLFSAMTSMKAAQSHPTADQKFFKPLEHKIMPAKFILYVNESKQLVLRFEDEKNCRRFLGKIGQGQIPSAFRKGPQFVNNKKGLIPVQESKHSLTFCTYMAQGGELAINLVDQTRRNNFITHLQLKLTSRLHLPISGEDQENYLNGQLTVFTNNPTALYFPELSDKPGFFIKVDGEKVLTGTEDLTRLATEPFDAICDGHESKIRSDSLTS